MKKIALSSGSREMNDNKITRAVDKNGEKVQKSDTKKRYKK